jgi:hypothetical protein
MAIQWWVTNKLVQELASGNVSEDQSLRYAMLSAVLATASLYYAYWVGADRTGLLLMEFAVVCAISLIGLYECFKANGRSNGSEFLKRLFCLGVPVGLKVFLVALLVSQLLYVGLPRIATSATFRNPYFVFELATFFSMGALTACYYWRIAHHMARIAKWERSNNSMQPTGQQRPAAD